MDRCTFGGRPVAEPEPVSRFEEEAQESSDVECVACNEACLEGTALTLMGLVYCTDCGADEAFRLRATGDEWSALTKHDQAEALEIIETQAHLERAALTRPARVR